MDIGKARREIADHYSKMEELQKLLEEIEELKTEVLVSINTVPTKPTDNLWSEMADVINCIIHVAIQWGKVDAVLEEVYRKLDRQIKRMEDET